MKNKAHHLCLGGGRCWAGQLHELAILLGLHQAVYVVVIGIVPHALSLQLQGVGMIVGPAVLGGVALPVASAPNMPTDKAHP